MKIDLAYCVELDRTVDIQEACQEFFAQEKYKKFHFLCSDPVCRVSKEEGVRVSGVNHTRLPEVDDVRKSPHYRQWDDHIPNCDWMLISDGIDEDDESDVETRPKSEPTRKSTRIVTKFIIPDEGDQTGSSDQIARQLDSIRLLTNPHDRRNALRKYASSIGSTVTNLEALVSCYDELKSINALDTCLTVQGKGHFSFRELFRHMKYGSSNQFAIYHGGARFYRWYGKEGFALQFMDPIHERSGNDTMAIPVQLYIPPKVMLSHKAGARLKRIVEQHEDYRKPYFYIYWIGGLERKEMGYNVSLKSLEHVAIRLKYPKTKSISQD